jgi:hypothetical protein
MATKRMSVCQQDVFNAMIRIEKKNIFQLLILELSFLRRNEIKTRKIGVLFCSIQMQFRHCQ